MRCGKRAFALLFVVSLLRSLATPAAQSHPNVSAATTATATAMTPGRPIALATVIPIPGLASDVSSPPFLFGDGRIDRSRSLYLLSDDNAGAVDVFDTRRNVFMRRISSGSCRLCRFSGIDASRSPSRSGPAAIALVNGTSAWVGDVGAVKLVDYGTGTIVRSVAILGADGFESRFRSEHACYDAKRRVLMIVNADDPVPFVTLLDTRSLRTVRRIDFPGALGLGNCIYLAKTERFYLAEAGSPAQQNGALLSFSLDEIRMSRPRPEARALTLCSPRGLSADATGLFVLVACDAVEDPTPRYSRASVPVPLKTELFNTGSDRFEPSISEVGGADEIAFDRRLRRWYVAAWRMTTNGNAGGSPLPILGIVDAVSHRWIANIPTSADAHAVAVDERSGSVYVPTAQSGLVPAGVMVFVPRVGAAPFRHR